MKKHPKIPPPPKPDAPIGGLTQHALGQMKDVQAELSERRLEALRLYVPMPRQDEIHKCMASERIVIGGNRAGKSLCVAVEAARAVTGQDPYGKYPKEDGTLVKRSRTEIERDIGNYTVIEHDGVIFACAALYPYPETRTAEMAALTVSPDVQGQGDGERVLKRIEQRARAAGLESIFVLSTRTSHWFIKRGFVQVDADWLPEARKRKYNWDRKSLVLVKKLG